MINIKKLSDRTKQSPNPGLTRMALNGGQTDLSFIADPAFTPLSADELFSRLANNPGINLSGDFGHPYHNLTEAESVFRLRALLGDELLYLFTSLYKDRYQTPFFNKDTQYHVQNGVLLWAFIHRGLALPILSASERQYWLTNPHQHYQTALKHGSSTVHAVGSYLEAFFAETLIKLGPQAVLAAMAWVFGFTEIPAISRATFARLHRSPKVALDHTLLKIRLLDYLLNLPKVPPEKVVIKYMHDIVSRVGVVHPRTDDDMLWETQLWIRDEAEGQIYEANADYLKIRERQLSYFFVPQSMNHGQQ